MNSGSKLNLKILITVLLLILIFILSVYYFDNYKGLVRNILESRLLTIVVWGYVIVTFVFHRFVVGSSESEDSFIFAHFGKYADTVFAIGTYGLASSTSLALIKGLYVQFFFETVYYSGFDKFDLISMFVLSTFLLIYSMFATTRAFVDLVYSSRTDFVEIKRKAG